MIQLYTDAATKGNPGIGGIGILIVTAKGQHQLHYPLASMSNHQAEFAAALAGFQAVKQLGLTGMISYYSDSKLVIDALQKRYAKHYDAELTPLLQAVDAQGSVLWQWIPERRNHGAHQLAQQGLRDAENQSKP